MNRTTNKIWRNKLENFVIEMHFDQRKNCKEIAEIIKKEKNIAISSEAVRKFLKEKYCTELP
jgi:transposase